MTNPQVPQPSRAGEPGLGPTTDARSRGMVIQGGKCRLRMGPTLRRVVVLLPLAIAVGALIARVAAPKAGAEKSNTASESSKAGADASKSEAKSTSKRTARKNKKKPKTQPATDAPTK